MQHHNNHDVGGKILVKGMEVQAQSKRNRHYANPPEEGDQDKTTRDAVYLGRPLLVGLRLGRAGVNNHDPGTQWVTSWSDIRCVQK